MKLKPWIFLLSLLPVTGMAMELVSQDDKMSYALGVMLARNMQKNEVALNMPAFVQGFEDAFQRRALILPDPAVKSLATQFQQQQIDKAKQQVGNMTAENLAKGQAFLDANKSKPGVVTLPSGLQIKVLTPGSGETPKPTSTVTVDYEGSLIDGTVFDSSYKRGKPISFGLNQVIKGWQEGVAQMKVGETAMLYIPASLGYGVQGVPGVIPANSALVFKVHLIAVQGS